MFTGLISHVGTLTRIEPMEDGRRIRVETSLSDGSLELGESIAVDGCCLTATRFDNGWFEAELSHETLARTAFGDMQEGRAVNLERAMRVGDRLGGHWVQGHVDGVGTLREVRPHGDMYDVDVETPAELARYIVEKGSIAIAGISLTVNRCDGALVGLTIIPHTWEHTTLARLRAGDRVNLEVDILAKYVESLLAHGRR